MHRPSVTLSTLICGLAFALTAAGCDISNKASGGGFPGSGAGGSGTAGAGAGGAAGGVPVANMPDAMCAMRAGSTNLPCSNCACTANASVPGGCLTELMNCQMNADAMFSTLCGAIIDCARMNRCSGMTCTTPCMAQIAAALPYTPPGGMMAAALTAATAVGTCTDMKCPGVCP